MLCRIIRALENISKVSRHIIRSGVAFATLLMLAAVYYIINPAQSLSELYFSEGLCNTAINIFAVVVIFALLGEVVLSRRQS